MTGNESIWLVQPKSRSKRESGKFKLNNPWELRCRLCMGEWFWHSFQDHGWQTPSTTSTCWRHCSDSCRPELWHPELWQLRESSWYQLSATMDKFLANWLTSRIARHVGERIHEQVQPHDITFLAWRVSPCYGWEAMFLEELGVDVMKHVCPYFTSIYFMWDFIMI